MSKLMTVDEFLYLFDLRGAVLLRGVLSQEEVGQAKAGLHSSEILEAAKLHGCIHTGFGKEWFYQGNEPATEGPVDLLTKPLFDMGAVFRRLTFVGSVAQYLSLILSPNYRLDHAYALVAASSKATGRHQMHNGSMPPEPSMSYFVRGGTILNGLVGVQYCLTPASAENGAFVFVPGSHKGDFTRPADLDVREVSCVVEAEAGDAIIFTEAVTHGSTAKSRHRRMALLYKYAPWFMQWEPGSPLMGARSDDWREDELSVVRGAGQYGANGDLSVERMG